MAGLTPLAARHELWRRGMLSWKMGKAIHQKDLYDLFHKSNHKIQVWLLSRRSGKTRTLCLLALEQCLRKERSIVKFVSPTKEQVNSNIRTIMRELLEDCPDSLKPEFKSKDYVYYFPNGSEIQLAGTDKGHAEKLRGANADICIIDEAGASNDLDYIVKSVLLPTTLITRGKVLIAGTPPRQQDHDFIKIIEEAEARGALIKKTIKDNVLVTPEMIEEIMIETNGEHTEAYRREYLCEIIKDSSISVVPEFTADLEKEIVKEWPKPPYYDSYEAMDLGFNDLTVLLFGYYDFRANKIIIEDELVYTGQEFQIPKFVKDIKIKEKELWFNILSNEVKPPLMRVSDINYIVTNEIARHSNQEVIFSAAQKDDKEAALNTLRVLLASKKIIISPKCKTLIRHLRNCRWASHNNRKVFARSPDDGHYDAVDAITYFVRHVNYSKNPYPAHYQGIITSYSNNYNSYTQKSPESQTDVYRKIFGLNKLKR